MGGGGRFGFAGGGHGGVDGGGRFIRVGGGGGGDMVLGGGGLDASPISPAAVSCCCEGSAIGPFSSGTVIDEMDIFVHAFVVVISRRGHGTCHVTD